MAWTLSVLVFSFCGLGQALEWTYHGSKGVDNWKDEFPVCGNGTRQSPIDIVLSNTTRRTYPDFVFSNYDSYGVRYIILNNGHTVQVRINGEVKVSGGGLDGLYKATQFHFHWGSTDQVGSEHTIDGKMYPLEVHIVHYKESYGTVGVAVNKPDGLAVLGYFFELDDSDNNDWDIVINGLGKIRNESTIASLNVFQMQTLFTKTSNQFYRYLGSLTTPRCQESVIWTVFKEPIKISSAQLSEFRKLSAGDEDAGYPYVVDNYRPVQPLLGRTVYASFDISAAPNLPVPSIAWYLSLAMLLKVLSL